MIIRFFIYMLLFYLGFKVVRSILNPGSKGAGRMFPSKPGEIDDIMIKDPVCNVYFPKREGIHLREKGKDLYFCSVQCRDKYLKQTTNETK